MTIIMHMDGSPIPEGEIYEDELEEVLEEIEEYGQHEANIKSEKSYVYLEKRESDDFLANMGVTGWYDFPRLLMTPLGDGKWGLIVDDEPERTVTWDELKAIVTDFIKGK